MKKNEKKANKISLKKTIVLILIVFLFGFGGVTLYFSIYKLAYVKSYNIEVETVNSNIVGLNAEPSLDFGKMPSNGGISTKELHVYNDWEIPLLLTVRVTGKAAEFISVSNNSFIIQPYEQKKILVYATVPKNFGRIGVFKGKAKVFFTRP